MTMNKITGSRAGKISLSAGLAIGVAGLVSLGLSGCGKNAEKPQSQAPAPVIAPKTEVLDVPVFEVTTNQLDLSVRGAIQDANQRLDQIAEIDVNDPAQLTFENTLVELDDIYYGVDLVWNRVGLISETSTDLALKAKAKELETVLSNWGVEADARKDVFEVVEAFSKTSHNLQDEDLVLLNKTLEGYQRQGFDKPAEVQAQIKTLKKELSEINQNISKNIATSNKAKLTLKKEELEGLSEDQLAQLNIESNGEYSLNVGVTYQIYAILDNAQKEETRKKVFIARMSRAKAENTPLITEVIEKRAKLAKLLGYDHWADYQTATKMAKTGATALQFLEDLQTGLQPKFVSEIAELSKIKKEETGVDEIRPWDIFYYVGKYEKKKFNLDLEGLRKFFKYETVLQGMFNIYENLFGIKLVKKTGQYVWDSKVELYELQDVATNSILGYLYLDMFPRPATEKYGHFASFTLRSGKVINGVRRVPVNALVCNFPLATAERPSLLSFDHVETLFHEFGHALHSILSQTKYASFAGTRVPRDFVEAPSQMLENWVTDKRVLDSFAFNYLDPAERIPADTLDKIKAAQKGTIGISYTRQFAYGLMDLKLHTLEDTTGLDVLKLTNQVFDEVYLEFPAETSFITAFGHLFGGYDAGYYGYAWADSLAADMASVFEASPERYLDKTIGMRLRKEIYEQGSGRDINESIEAFLGRKPNNKAFLIKLGIEMN